MTKQLKGLKRKARLKQLNKERFKTYRALDENVQRRKRAEIRFKWYGISAITLCLMALFLLVGSIALRGISGMQQAELLVPLDPTASYDATHNYQPSDFLAPLAEQTGISYRELRQLVSLDGTPTLNAGHHYVSFIAADPVDLWLKETLSEKELLQQGRLTERQLAWLRDWQGRGNAGLTFDLPYFQTGDSREPELAGFLGAMFGSFWLLIVCLAVAFPVGVLAAIYLEEFAPKGRITDLIEVNINNLAAVPSIVFGLLGLAIYINLFGMPRSSPLVGGLTLALLVLPVIIISSRASLRAVPSSIRDAARGLGASELQIILHHTFPLALPGIITGTILSIARAIGETAPLLMIGMVAFIADLPGSPTQPSTAMPVQIYLWASSPERSFVDKTAAASLVLLAILFSLSLLAIWLRRKYEKSW